MTTCLLASFFTALLGKKALSSNAAQHKQETRAENKSTWAKADEAVKRILRVTAKYSDVHQLSMIDDDLSSLLQLPSRLLLVRHQNEVENVQFFFGRNTFQAMFNDCEYLTTEVND